MNRVEPCRCVCFSLFARVPKCSIYVKYPCPNLPLGAARFSYHADPGMQVSSYLLDTLLPSYAGAKESKDLIVSHNKSFETHRASFGYPTDASPKANPWVGLMEPHLQKFLELHKALIFSTDHDGVLKLSLRAGKSAIEAMEEGSLSEKFQEIQDMMKKTEPATIMIDEAFRRATAERKSLGPKLSCNRFRSTFGLLFKFAGVWFLSLVFDDSQDWL